MLKKFTQIFNVTNHQITKIFIRHNEKIFYPYLNNIRPHNNAIILMELNNLHSSHIAYSYLGAVLAKKFNANLVAYSPLLFDSLLRRTFIRIKKFINVHEFAVYRSFGIKKFIIPNISEDIKKSAAAVYESIYKKLNSKYDIENISIKKVWVGDLIYDTYLRRFNEPTIEKDSLKFKNFLKEMVEQFFFWDHFFSIHNIKAINVSHCVYNLAIPLRIALSRNIPAFQSNFNYIYRLNKKNMFAYNDFYSYKDSFSALTRKTQKVGVDLAKNQIKRRFFGEIGVDMQYSTKSAYSSLRYKKLIINSPRVKILIATHCFFDSPHSYGKNIFPDFYEWLDFLGEISCQTDYDWYIKTHPDYLPGTMKIIEYFIAKYPKFRLLPSNASHHQIIEEGIDFALTTYGTIGFEYAALGIPVINASLNNPHVAFDFNLHPKNLREYKKILFRLDKIKFKPNRNSVYEYYFMKHIFYNTNIFTDDMEYSNKKLIESSFQFSPMFYNFWVESFSLKNHNKTISEIIKFIASKEFRFTKKNFGVVYE